MIDSQQKRTPHIVWVFTDSLHKSLDAATWLETSAELRRMGWCVTLLAEGQPGLQQIRDIELYGIRKPSVYLMRQLLFHVQVLYLLLRQWSSVDVIFFHQMSAPWILPLRWLRRLTGRSRPLIVMDTRTVPMIPKTNATRKDRLRNAYDKFMNRLANRWADGQTAITHHMAEEVGIPPRQLLGVWPSGVNLSLFSPAQTQREWPGADSPVHLIYVGAMHKQRNLLGLSRAVEAANAEGLCFTFSIVGDGTARAELETYARQTQGRIRVLPPVPHTAVPGLLAEAHVGVLPFPNQKRFRVSSPIKLFEYMAAGMPILATRIECHTDVVGDGQYAFWAEDGSEAALLGALRDLWRARSSLSVRGGLAAEAALDWTWPASAHKLSRALSDGLLRADPKISSLIPQGIDS